MSTTDSTESVIHNPARRRRWSKEIESPMMRIVLLGKDVSANSRVGNFMLGRSVFESEAPPDDHQIERVRGKDMMIINCPHLLQLNLSYHQMIQTVRECVDLSHPGPHVIILIFKHNDCSREDQEHLEIILNSFSHSFYQHTIVLTTHDSHSYEHKTEVNDNIQKIIKKCFNRHFRLKRNCTSDELKETFRDIVKSNDGRYLICDVYEDAQSSSMKWQTDERGAEVKAGNLECLRIMLIGRTGSGKSATGNTILGKKLFQSKPSSDSVMTVCDKEVGEFDGQSVAVVDTPGVFDTTTQKEQVLEEIIKCVLLSAPGPHAFIIVLSLGRFTQEESETVDLIKMFFGPKIAQFSIILFTRGDDLKDETIEDYVKTSKSAELKKLIRDCGNRYMAFNNRETQDRTQVMKLIKMIEEMKTTNHGQYFTNSMFEEAEMSIKKRMEEILKEKEREIQAQIEEMKAKHEIEMENMKKRLEEEKRNANEQKVQMEKKFRKYEETLRNEFEEKEKTEQKKREKEKQKQLEEEKQQRAHQRESHEEQLREKQEEMEKMREKFEKEREEERQKREEERWIQRQERNQKEREYEEKRYEMMKHYEKLERERKKQWERKRQEYDEKREEERKRWEKRNEDIEREKEEYIKRRETQERERKVREEKEWEEMKEEHEVKMKEMKKKHEDEARKQAEELTEFRERNEEHVKELKEMLEERQKQQELLETLYQHFKEQKGEEVRELQQNIERLRKYSECVIQ